MTVLEQLAEFIKEVGDGAFPRSKWLEDDIMRVYVRKGYHVLSSKKASWTLDIASVEVNEENQNQGVWTNFLAKAQEMNPWDAVYVECVLNPDLAKSLIRQGWMTYENAPQCYFMPKNVEKFYETMFLEQKYGQKPTF